MKDDWVRQAGAGGVTATGRIVIAATDGLSCLSLKFALLATGATVV